MRMLMMMSDHNNYRLDVVMLILMMIVVDGKMNHHLLFVSLACYYPSMHLIDCDVLMMTHPVPLLLDDLRYCYC
jgi:hypothetical protein